MADFNRLTMRGTTGEIELRDGFDVCPRRTGSGWELLGLLREADKLRATGQVDEVTWWVAMIEGHPKGQHGLPGFAEALAVQETIEASLPGV